MVRELNVGQSEKHQGKVWENSSSIRMFWGVGAWLEGIEVFVLSAALLRMSSSVCAEATGVCSLHHVYMHYCVFCACKHRYMFLSTIMSIHGWVYVFMYVSVYTWALFRPRVCDSSECGCVFTHTGAVWWSECQYCSSLPVMFCFAAVCFWVFNYYHVHSLLCVCVLAFKIKHIQKSGRTY